eukprot:CAMPEP_0176489510 /NCGR_PEP_ID=MMETSP0200_2-20121128/7329_1 /TAXON_ID=947934 /ORGANISM="Chaetoceros sp., Strain GSL56" /LENGTH=335 /DNA_ID=CAMNT_0017886661 /DNA_START=171 /DNA_END=1175 /DNA_ORIENTATION=+
MNRTITSTATPLFVITLKEQHSKRYKTSDEKQNITSSQSSVTLPPLVIYPTASPFVYVSSATIESYNDDDDNMLHPKSLFTQTKAPPSFEKSHFRYISPTEFNYELPNLPIPEVAFLGRSNVGKSSLLNALTTKNLAKTSKTPGRTQQVNYFGLFPHSYSSSSSSSKQSPTNKNSSSSMNDALGCIIDLPGYGYAHAPDEIVTKWQERTQDFLQQRISLGNMQRVYILLDARRGLTPFDSSIMGWLDEAECDYTAVLTKCDAVSKAMIVRFANEICMRYHVQRLAGGDGGGGHQSPCVHVTSSRKHQGILDLMWAIDADFLNGCDILRQLHLHRM